MTSSRRQQIICEIISDLEGLKDKISVEHSYALQENIKFFRSCTNVYQFAKWLLFEVKKVDGKRLLELSDFPLPKWQTILMEDLEYLERRKAPAVIAPLKNYLVGYILKNKPKFIIEFGFGSMELVRQVIISLIQKKYQHKIIIIGFDNSSSSHSVAVKNLLGIEGLKVIQSDLSNRSDLQEILDNGGSQYSVVISKRNIFTLDSLFNDNEVKLIFYSKFQHHLSDDDKIRLHSLVERAALNYVEFDDYLSWPLIVPQAIVAWNRPVLLNGAIFSRLRDYTKSELLEMSKHDKIKLDFFSVGSYLRTKY